MAQSKPKPAAAAVKGKPSSAKSQQRPAHGKGKPGPRPASDADTAAIQKLLARQKDKRKQPPAAPAADEPDAKRPKKREGREKIQEAIRLWEELRQHETPTARRQELVTEILSLIKGHMANVAASPTASRIIQSCVKHGTAAHRAAIVAEVQPQLVELAQNPYGHFLVSKLLASASRAEAADIMKSFKGRVPQLLRHPNGASVIDDAYNAAYPAQRNAMAAEFYGKEFTLFEGSVPASLAEVLAAADAVKKRQVLQNVTQHLIPIMEKGIVDPVLSHRLIAEYLAAAPTSAVEDAVQTLSGMNLLRMAHTRDGSAAAAAVLAYGTAKDRKQAIKAMQGHTKTMASDQWAHLVLMTALSRVDDTALLRKHVISELQSNLAELLDNISARRVLLQLLNPAACRRLLSPEAAAVLEPTPRFRAAAPAAAAAAPDAAAADADAAGPVASAATGEQAAEAQQQQQVPLGLSKKDKLVRRRELLGSGKGSLAGALLAATASAAAALLHGKNSSDLLAEAVRGGSHGILQEAAPDALAALHDAVVELAARPVGAEGEAHVLTEFYSSRALRLLVLSSAEATYPAASAFVDKLWFGVFDGNCQQYLGGHAEKVLAALLESGSDATQQAARKQLQDVLDQPLDAWLAQHKKAEAPKAKKAKAAAKEAGKMPAKTAGKAAVKSPAKAAAGKRVTRQSA